MGAHGPRLRRVLRGHQRRRQRRLRVGDPVPHAARRQPVAEAQRVGELADVARRRPPRLSSRAAIARVADTSRRAAATPRATRFDVSASFFPAAADARRPTVAGDREEELSTGPRPLWGGSRRRRGARRGYSVRATERTKIDDREEELSAGPRSPRGRSRRRRGARRGYSEGNRTRGADGRAGRPRPRGDEPRVARRITWMFRGDESRRCRGGDAERWSRSAASADRASSSRALRHTWIVCGVSRRRRGRQPDIPSSARVDAAAASRIYRRALASTPWRPRRLTDARRPRRQRVGRASAPRARVAAVTRRRGHTPPSAAGLRREDPGLFGFVEPRAPRAKGADRRHARGPAARDRRAAAPGPPERRAPPGGVLGAATARFSHGVLSPRGDISADGSRHRRGAPRG